MKITLIFSLLFIAVNAVPAKPAEFTGKRWVVLCAGGAGWYNYPFQASIYHAYHIFRDHGIPEENIIVMHPDDLANNKANPTPGVVVNKPNGTDVYHDVPKHYIQNDLTPKNFLSVLKGDQQLKAQGKRVVESGPNDHVFVFFMDHGSTELVGFPHGTLFAKDLNNVLVEMHKNKRFSKMLFYLEACESGSMFEKLLPKDINVYAVSSSKPKELSWACCYDSFRKAYVGGHFSDYWYSDTETHDLNTETIEQQFKFIADHFKVQVQNDTFEHAQHYGDLSIGQMTLAEFFGPKKPTSHIKTSVSQVNQQCEYVSSRDIAIHLVQKNIENTQDISEKIGYTEQLQHLLNGRQYADKHLNNMLNTLKPMTGWEASSLLNTRLELNNRDCYQRFVEAFSDNCFNLSQNPYLYGKLNVFVNICEVLETNAQEQAINTLVNYCKQNVQLDLNIQ